MPVVAKRMKDVPVPKKPEGPIWKGPEEDGITFSLLSRFLCCRERFRLLVVEGLKPAEQFYPPIDFGNMWHLCEEKHAAKEDWRGPLKAFCASLCGKFKFQQDQIDHWYSVTQELFPIYVEHWAKHPDVKARTPLLQEQVFDVPYQLPSGRTVRLRGKWDSVDLVGKGKDAGVWIQENKTKSSIDRQKIERQLTFDLQTMVYLIALESSFACDPQLLMANGKPLPAAPIKGVRYNVIRRSAHKSTDSMLKKLTEDSADGRINEWFSRWSCGVSAADVVKFKQQCLDPILEQLCDWWEWVSKNPIASALYVQHKHWRHPFGVYDVLAEGGASDLDNYLETGSEVGLQRTTSLFPELG